MSAASHNTITNPDDSKLKLGSGKVVSLTQLVDDLQTSPTFPLSLQVYERSKILVTYPTCQKCNKDMDELATHRNNGWSCSGIDLPGGCLSNCSTEGVGELIEQGKYDLKHFAANTIRLNGHNTAGWLRWRCFECDYDFCEKCMQRNIKQHRKESHLEWRYTARSETNSLPNNITVDLIEVVQNKLPIFIIITDEMQENIFGNFLNCYQLLPKQYHSFRNDLHLFLVVSPGHEHSTFLHSFSNKYSKYMNDDTSTKSELKVPIDIITEDEYSTIANRFHNTEAIFTIRFACAKDNNKELKELKESQESPTVQAPKLGIRILKMPSRRYKSGLVTLLGKAVSDWLSVGRGMPALQLLMKWHYHLLKKEKKLVMCYGKHALLLDPSNSIRHQKLLFPLTTSFVGSDLIDIQHGKIPMCLRLEEEEKVQHQRHVEENVQHAEEHVDVELKALEYPPRTVLPLNTTSFLTLPSDVLSLIVSLLQNDIRSTRYVLTTCTCMMSIVRTTLYHRLRLYENGLRSNSNIDQNLLEKTSNAAITSAPPDLHKTLDRYRTASKRLSVAMVTLGIPHRIVWRMKQHKLRGNAEFKMEHYGRALCHYMLIFKCFNKLSVYMERDYVISQLANEVAPDFDFNAAHEMDKNMLYAVEKNSTEDEKDTYTFGIDELLKEFDERVLGYCSVASSELDSICIQSLCNASLCLIKLSKIDYALQFAKYAKEAPTHVKGWRGQSKMEHFKPDIRIGQSLQALQRFDEAKVVFRNGLNKWRSNSKITKQFRKCMKNVKQCEQDYQHAYRSKLQEVDANDMEKEKEQKEEEERKALEEREARKDDIFR